jgi:hypothetical protein
VRQQCLLDNGDDAADSTGMTQLEAQRRAGQNERTFVVQDNRVRFEIQFSIAKEWQ